MLSDKKEDLIHLKEDSATSTKCEGKTWMERGKEFDNENLKKGNRKLFNFKC